jgi:hypothetical protein
MAEPKPKDRQFSTTCAIFFTVPLRGDRLVKTADCVGESNGTTKSRGIRQMKGNNYRREQFGVIFGSAGRIRTYDLVVNRRFES